MQRLTADSLTVFPFSSLCIHLYTDRADINGSPLCFFKHVIIVRVVGETVTGSLVNCALCLNELLIMRE